MVVYFGIEMEDSSTMSVMSWLAIYDLMSLLKIRYDQYFFLYPIKVLSMRNYDFHVLKVPKIRILYKKV